MQPICQYLADTLKSLRTERGWSLDRAAKETGVSKAMLGQIERGESSPTIARLWKIADGFGVSLSMFIEPPLKNQAVEIRQVDSLRKQPATDPMLVAPLFPFDPQFGFEMFELTLLPGYERYSDPHQPGVTEHVVVIEGTLELFLDGEWISLIKGEAVRYDADRPHGYRNLLDAPAVFHNLIHYPAGNGSPA